MRLPKDAAEVLSVLPWRSGLVTLILVAPNDDAEWVLYAKSLVEKYKLLGDSTSQDRVLVCWPGEYSQDIFELAFGDREQVRRWVKPREGA